MAKGRQNGMMDDGLGPKRIRVDSPRGMRYTVVTSEEIVTVRLYADGRTYAGRRRADESAIPHIAVTGTVQPVDMFEFAIGAPGYARWVEPTRSSGEGFETAVVLWMDAQPMSWLSS